MINKLRNKFNKDIHFKEILTGSAITFALKMGGMLLGYIVMLIISRQYGAEGIGIYNLSLSVLTFITTIAMMGTNTSSLRYVGQFNKDNSAYKLKLLFRYILELVVPLSVIFGIMLFVGAEWIAKDIFHNEKYILALKLVAFIIPFFALQQISVEFIRGLKKLQISEYLRSVNRPLFNLILLSIGGLYITNILLPLYTLTIGTVVGSVYGLYFIARHLSKITVSTKKDFSKKELLSTSSPMMITAITSFITSNISLFLLEIYSTTEEVGVFSVVLKIAILISLILMIVNIISAPKFSELYWTNQYSELQKVINISSKLIFITSLLTAIVIIVFKQFILSLFGDRFIHGDIVLVLLVAGQMVDAMAGSVGVFLNMTGHQKTSMYLSIFVMLLTTLMSYLLIPDHGMYGAAISFIIGISVKNIVAAWLIQVKHGFRTYYVPFYKKSGEL